VRSLWPILLFSNDNLLTASLPDTFTTPMFWSADELLELKATAVLGKYPCLPKESSRSHIILSVCFSDKIGKAEAEKDYHNKLLPAVNSRPDIFQPSAIEVNYSLERYHIMGSRILSRCFTVEKWSGDEENIVDEAEVAEEAEADDATPVSLDAADTGDQSLSNDMDVDGPSLPVDSEVKDAVDGDSDDEDDVGNIAMVPMADMLNARFGSENVRSLHTYRSRFNEHVLFRLSSSMNLENFV
jgi:N-lysine methyltransferase SETD6